MDSIIDTFNAGIKHYWQSLPKVLPFVLALIVDTIILNYTIYTLHLHGPTLEQSILFQIWASLITCVLFLFLLVPALCHQVIFFSRQTRLSLSFSVTAMLKRYHHFIIAFTFIIFLTTLGTIFLLIPGFISLVMSQFYLPIMLMTKKGPFKSYQITFDLIWPRWWMSVAILFIPAIFIFFTSYFIQYMIKMGFEKYGIAPDFMLFISIDFTVLLMFLPLLFSIIFIYLRSLLHYQEYTQSV
jgi:hypothetical protein